MFIKKKQTGKVSLLCKKKTCQLTVHRLCGLFVLSIFVGKSLNYFFSIHCVFHYILERLLLTLDQSYED